VPSSSGPKSKPSKSAVSRVNRSRSDFVLMSNAAWAHDQMLGFVWKVTVLSLWGLLSDERASLLRIACRKPSQTRPIKGRGDSQWYETEK
jgi:hypothetical protein